MLRLLVLLSVVCSSAFAMVGPEGVTASVASTFGAPSRTEPLQLTDDTTAEEYPLPSPDGSIVVFNQSETGDTNHIYTVPTDGSGVKTDISPGDETYWFPDYNPAGTYLCYVNGPTDADLWEVVKYEVGGSETVLTDNATTDRDSWMPRWSHAGGNIAYIRRFWDQYPNNDELVVIADDGTNERSVHTFSGQIYGIDWNTAGTSLCVAGNDGSGGELYTAPPNAGASLTQVGTDTNVKDCHWSADGSKIVYIVSSGPTTEVKSINPDGSGATVLFDRNTFGLNPVHAAWTDDGAGVIFHTGGTGGDIFLTETFAGVNPASLGNIKASFR